LRIPVQAISFFVLILLAASFSAAIAGPGDDDWEFRLIPYLWFIGSTGELTVNGETADLDAGFSDIWDNLNIVAMGQFEARKGDWTFALDGLYLDLRDRSESWLVKTRSNLRYGIIESFAACRFVSLPLGGGPDPPTLEFEEIFGGRFVYAKSQTDIFPGSGLSDSRWWLDPFIGFRIACRTGSGGISAASGSGPPPISPGTFPLPSTTASPPRSPSPPPTGCWPSTTSRVGVTTGADSTAGSTAPPSGSSSLFRIRRFREMTETRRFDSIQTTTQSPMRSHKDRPQKWVCQK